MKTKLASCLEGKWLQTSDYSMTFCFTQKKHHIPGLLLLMREKHRLSPLIAIGGATTDLVLTV